MNNLKLKNREEKHHDAVLDILAQEALNEKLIIIIGAGVSIGLTNGDAVSWTELIQSGFNYGKEKGCISEKQYTIWAEQLNSSDIDDLLGAAEFMGRKLGSPNEQTYARWLESEFSSMTPSNTELVAALKHLSELGIPLCTLNYDHLLETITRLPTILVNDSGNTASWIKRDKSGILHLHGSWETPSSCILGIRDYETTQINQVRDLFQRSMAVFNRILFIGCGETFSDPNFSALIKWLKIEYPALTPMHYALTLDSDVANRKSDPAWSNFVEPLSYGKSHDDLASFLLKIFSKPASKKPKKLKDSLSSKSNLVIEKYREFLLRDCGQMTIEGVSADMDTGQRKFDLERLFVPLKVLACPPEFSINDPERESKRNKWNEENKESVPFGEILSEGKSLALLALPGGGKTLLLKRLAVAYASPSRRNSSSDELPEISLLPILIRCREWRTHIKLPIPTLLKNIADITGQSDLTGLSEAIIPLLVKGEVLLLIDGLDEIHNDADRTIFVDNLESFLEQYKKTRVVVTSREAGFNLVAPSLSRFCERWKIAPLEDKAINLLCFHWHRLMVGESPLADAEAQDVAKLLINNDSLRRLAENPLLLTMLLVVKHGAGSLPPDRVSLYDRAVDVLLDTWNIKGHEPLNAKEAVPQLAYIAFQLMCMGKQTATEKELLKLLENAREEHPNIRRYAKDSPYEFLKRVELRSSLLLEAGFQMEQGRAVPFYQFRHLTFQEYLASVAVTEGHYKNYKQEDTVLTPLVDYLLAEEWKEIIPMVSVLARKRAEPLLQRLILNATDKRKEKNTEDDNDQDLENGLTGSVALLAQCLIEEAEASPDTLEKSLNLIAYFATGHEPIDNWESLCRGPYGKELFSQAWALFSMIGWRDRPWIMNTAASIAEYQKSRHFWQSNEGKENIISLLKSSKNETKGFGLLVCMGSLWNYNDNDDFLSKAGSFIPIHLVQELLFDPEPTIFSAATWTWANFRRHQKEKSLISTEVLDQLLHNWLGYRTYRAGDVSAFALSKEINCNRGFWKPKMTLEQISFIRDMDFSNISYLLKNYRYDSSVAFMVGFHLFIWTDDELLKIYELFNNALAHRIDKLNFEAIERHLGLINTKVNKRKRSNRQ